MRIAPHVWLFLTLAGCGSITPFSADADATLAAPTPPQRGTSGPGSAALDASGAPTAGTTSPPPADCETSRSNAGGNDQEMGKGAGPRACDTAPAPGDKH